MQKGVCAVVEFGTYIEEQTEELQAMHASNSELYRPFFKEVQMAEDGEMESRLFLLADVEAFVRPVTVIPDVGSDIVTKYFELIPHSEWAVQFMRFLEDAHEDIEDDEDEE